MTVIKVRQVVKYGGHSVGANGNVNLTLKASYSELPNTVKLLQLLNNDIELKVRMPGGTATKLGMMRLKEAKVDGDGESIIKLNGLSDYVELDNLNSLIAGEEFAVLYKGEVEEEDEENDESE
jgi:hypothetical protein|nr:MAG TPA: hypothetical protein [Caudoviricetes sp.]